MRCVQPYGFTLVELITVIVLLGILSMGSVAFISDSTSGLASTVARTELAGDARFAVDRIKIGLRDALPNSLRVSGSCLEYIPIQAATTYRTLPTTTPATEFKVVPMDPAPTLANSRFAVYPSTAVYTVGSPGELSPAVSLSAPDVNNEVTVTLATAHQYTSPSPTQRAFLVQTPRSFCIDSERLWRYTNYGFLSTQPSVASLPNTRPNRALLAQNTSGPTPFRIDAPALARNAVVLIDITFARGGDAVRIQDQVQVRNVP